MTKGFWVKDSDNYFEGWSEDEFWERFGFRFYTESDFFELVGGRFWCPYAGWIKEPIPDCYERSVGMCTRCKSVG
jgi:hypothetical protein